MLQAQKYLFYRLYCWASHWKWDTTPQITAFIQISVLTWFNCFLVVEIAHFALRGRAAPFSSSAVVASMIVVALPQYFLFLRNGKYRALIDAFRGESHQDMRRWDSVVVWYVVLSLALPLCFAFFCGIHSGLL